MATVRRVKIKCTSNENQISISRSPSSKSKLYYISYLEVQHLKPPSLTSIRLKRASMKLTTPLPKLKISGVLFPLPNILLPP